jgi:regulator of protease activity HflC (stomatin/prohibitin superfamily)
MSVVIGVVVVLLVLLVLVLSSSVKVLREYERGVIFRLGRLKGGASGPGLFLLIPVIDRIVRIDLRIVTLQVPPQDIISKDNVPVRVTAVVYFRIVDPRAAVVAIENYLVGTSQIAQTTLRSVLGQHTLDELLAERDKINEILQDIIDQHTAPWGIKISVVEVKDVELPTTMQRAMARQAEAERERRAKIIGAQGEYEAAEQLSLAADRIAASPIALQLRYLQTLLEISSSNNATTILPIPIDILRPLQDAVKMVTPPAGS